MISGACALALAANSLLSVGVLAQDKTQERRVEKSKQRVERTVVIEQEGEGSENFDVLLPAPVAGYPALAVGGFSFAGHPQQGAEQTFQFVSAEMAFDNKVVKGAPFSGEMVYESVQTLADGNRIVNRSSTPIFRDSQGRTRREQSFTFFGPFGGGNSERRTIHIFDPVNNSTYMLDPQNRTATKTMSMMKMRSASSVSAVPAQLAEGAPRQINVSGGVLQGSAIKRVPPAYPPIAKAARAQGPVRVRITVNEAGEVLTADVEGGHPLLRDSAIEAAKQWQFKPTTLENKAVKVNGVLTFNFTLADKDAPQQETELKSINTVSGYAGQRIKIDSKTEALGKQSFDGVEAEGTRIIETIPAGAIGNERPLEIIRERWYSPELQMVVFTRNLDPRLGETTQRLTNINRSEPDASYFQIPSDFNVRDGDNFRLM
jgi:TonB family protein